MVFEQVLKMGIVPDVYMISIVVNAHCREGSVECAERFVEKMEGMGFEVNVMVYNALVGGYVCKGDLDGAERVLGLMLGKGVERNVVTWTLLMKCYCRRGRADEAERLLRRMGGWFWLTMCMVCWLMGFVRRGGWMMQLGFEMRWRGWG